MNNLMTIEPRRAPWRMLNLGSTVWAAHGEGWRPAIVIHLGKNRAERTIVVLSFETGGKGKRYAGELWWRQASGQWPGQAAQVASRPTGWRLHTDARGL
jgi:hypothetical protein